MLVSEDKQSFIKKYQKKMKKSNTSIQRSNTTNDK